MTSSTSEQPSGPPRTRRVALDTAPLLYRVEVALAVSARASTEEVAHLYWAVQGLQPAKADVTEDKLTASFLRYARSADALAWELVAEVGALPGAVISELTASRVDDAVPEIVLEPSASPRHLRTEASA